MLPNAFSVSVPPGSSDQPMLQVCLREREPTPNAGSIKLLQRKLAKELGVCPRDFIRLYNTKTPDGDLPLLALDLSNYEHLSGATAVKKAKTVLDEYASRLRIAALPSRRRSRREKRRPTNRLHHAALGSH